MASFVDSHVHLADAAFDADRDEVIERARLTGAGALVCIGESLDAARRAGEIASRHPGFVYHTAGVHPFDAESYDPARHDEGIRAEVARGAVAIGEGGLDFTSAATAERQRAAPAAQRDLARELARPAVGHTRNAEDDTREMVVAAGRAG